MKIEVGMYVKTKRGYICKIVNINDFRELNMKYGVKANYLKDIMFIGDEDIIKASYNIIDLIEAGDYVNGILIESIYKREKDRLLCHCWNEEIMFEINSNSIQSILTKEQFEREAYKI